MKNEKPKKKKKRLTVKQKFAIVMRDGPAASVGLPSPEAKEIKRLDKTKFPTVLPEGYVFGRPTKYRPEYCEHLVEHMARGFSFETFNPNDDVVSSATLLAWLEKYPDFLNAKERGTKLSRDWWESQAHIGMYHPNFKVAAWRLSMANRFGWSEKQDIKHSGGIGGLSKKYEGMTDEEIEAELVKKPDGDDKTK